MSLLLDYFVSALVTIIYLICVCNLGMVVFRLSGIEKILLAKNGVIYFSLATLFGLGLISNYWLIIGLHSFLSLSVVTISLIILASFSFKFKDKYMHTLNDLRSCFKLIGDQDLLIRTSLYLSLLLLLLLGAASLIIMPWGDSEAFYMVWPKLISHLGAVIPQPNYFMFSQIGISGEMHFAVLMTLFSGQSASFLVWYVALFIIVVMIGICHECNLDRDSKILCYFLVLSSSAFIAIIPFGNVNIFAAGFASVAIYLMLLTLKGASEKSIMMITGLLLGFAMLAKLSYAVVLFPIVALLLIFYLFTRSDYFNPALKKTTLYSSIILMMVLAAFIPHFYKNFLLFNEPFAPFYFFQTVSENGILDQVWFDSDITRRIVWTYPFVLTFGDFPMQAGNISPLILILFPLIFFSYRQIQKSTLKANLSLILGSVSLISIVVWVILKPSVVAPRYILISFLLLFPFLCYLYQSIDFNSIKKVVRFSLVFVILFTFLHQPVPMLGKMIFNELKGNSQLNHRFYNASHFLNQTVTQDERIYLAGYYSYQLSADILSDLQSPVDYQRMGDLNDQYSESEYLTKLSQLGFTYIFIQKESHSHLITNRFLQEEQQILFQDEYSVIVKLK